MMDTQKPANLQPQPGDNHNHPEELSSQRAHPLPTPPDSQKGNCLCLLPPRSFLCRYCSHVAEQRNPSLSLLGLQKSVELTFEMAFIWLLCCGSFGCIVNNCSPIRTAVILFLQSFSPLYHAGIFLPHCKRDTEATAV